MDVLKEYHLSDGRKVRILRQITPDPAGVPVRMREYMLASLGGEDTFRSAAGVLNYWRQYYHTAFIGEGVTDHLYFAEVDGEYAARVWFGYDPVSGFGNFGNVYTEKRFRKLGLLGEILDFMIPDFHASKAHMLCCATGTPFVSQIYIKRGFHMIYGGETGPMCLLDPAWGNHFADVEKRCFDGSPVTLVRPGKAADQFACDKFLDYTSALRGKRRGRSGPDAEVVDYRTAWQMQLAGSAYTAVAENRSGTVVGFAYAAMAAGQCCMNFNLHPDNLSELRPLLTAAAAGFRERYPEKAAEPLMIYLDSSLETQLEAVRLAEITPAGRIPGVAAGRDLLVFRFGTLH